MRLSLSAAIKHGIFYAYAPNQFARDLSLQREIDEKDDSNRRSFLTFSFSKEHYYLHAMRYQFVNI